MLRGTGVPVIRNSSGSSYLSRLPRPESRDRALIELGTQFDTTNRAQLTRSCFPLKETHPWRPAARPCRGSSLVSWPHASGSTRGRSGGRPCGASSDASIHNEVTGSCRHAMHGRLNDNRAEGRCSAVVESATSSNCPALPVAPDRWRLAGIGRATRPPATVLVMLIPAGALLATATGQRQPGRLAGEKALVTERKNSIAGPGTGCNGDGVVWIADVVLADRLVTNLRLEVKQRLERPPRKIHVHAFPSC